MVLRRAIKTDLSSHLPLLHSTSFTFSLLARASTLLTFRVNPSLHPTMDNLSPGIVNPDPTRGEKRAAETSMPDTAKRQKSRVPATSNDGSFLFRFIPKAFRTINEDKKAGFDKPVRPSGVEEDGLHGDILDDEDIEAEEEEGTDDTTPNAEDSEDENIDHHKQQFDEIEKKPARDYVKLDTPTEEVLFAERSAEVGGKYSPLLHSFADSVRIIQVFACICRPNLLCMAPQTYRWIQQRKTLLAECQTQQTQNPDHDF
jgi:hypothetical protein